MEPFEGGSHYLHYLHQSLLLLLLLNRFSHVQLCATHRWQTTRLLSPWDSPGKNNGVGSHFFLQCMKVKSENEVAQSCPTLTIVSVQFSSVAQSCLTLCNPMEACQASLSIINSWSLLKLVFIELVMPSNHLILCRPLLLLPPIPPSIRVFSNESVLHIRWPKYWSFSFNISPSNEHQGLISFRMD